MENVDMGDPADDNSNSAAIQKLLRESGYTVRSLLGSSFVASHEKDINAVFVSPGEAPWT